ncbi:MAG: hypothetical protein J7K47_06770 [Thermoplasmata archaeon]|nr:hypothetical protein [Thermoplasmata archaeon]
METMLFSIPKFSPFYNAVSPQTKHSFGGNTSKFFVFSYPIKNSFRVIRKAVVVQSLPLQYIEMALKNILHCGKKKHS